MVRVAVITADFYTEIAQGLEDKANAVFEQNKVDPVPLRVPGAFELPMALAMAIKSEAYKGYVVLGCVVQGETDHYRYVCENCCRSVMALACDADAPLGFGVLTVATLEQARARLYYGERAAQACLKMMALQEKLRGLAS